MNVGEEKFSSPWVKVQTGTSMTVISVEIPQNRNRSNLLSSYKTTENIHK